ncbi:MAG: ester cyclase [Shimia sp.]
MNEQIEITADIRHDVRGKLARLAQDPSVADAILAPDCVFDLAWPLNRIEGRGAVADRFYGALHRAFRGVHRRDLMFIGGQNIRAEGGYWVASVTHYVGTLRDTLFGLEPTGHLAFFRAGEFYRIEDGLIAEAKIIFDLPDLMLQAGRFPLGRSGTEITFPAPATQDGLCPVTGDGDTSIDIINRMIAGLHVFDPDTMESEGQTGADGVWADDMMWYGPAGIGSNYEWAGFVQDHRLPFLRAFPDRKGGNHYCRFGDGHYAAISGWPSMTMTFGGDYLGHTATGQAMTLRVMDFYRTDGRQIKENWVCLDYGDLFHQLGRDLIAESNAIA